MAGLTFASILPSFIGGLATLAVGSMLRDEAPQQQQPQAAAPPPEIEKPTEMPTPNDAARRAAQRRSIAQQMARRGRASTILTDNAEAKLGG